MASGYNDQIDRIFGGARNTPAPSANLNLAQGVDTSPDDAALNSQLARRFGTTPDTIANERDVYSSQAKAADAWAAVEQAPKTQAWLAANPQNARVSHDDVGLLAGIENHVKGFFYGLAQGIDNVFLDDTPARVVVPKIAKQTGSALWSGALGMGSGLLGYAQGAEEAGVNYDITAPIQRRLFGGTAENFFGNIFKAGADRLQASADYYKPDPTGSYIGDQVLGGISNLPSTVLALGGGLGARALGASVEAASAVGALSGGVTQGGQSYRQARAEGVAPVPAFLYANADLATETAGEYLGEHSFLKSTEEGKSILTRFLKSQVGEQVGEQFSTVAQDFSAWVALPSNKDKTFGDFLGQLPGDMLDTAIQTLVVGAAANATIGGIERAANLTGYRQRVAAREQQRAQAEAEQLQTLVAGAGQSATRERDPVSFQSYMEAQTQDGPLEHVYVDGQKLNQMLTEAGQEGSDLVNALPSVRDQLADAVATGGDVRIPTAELTTYLPGHSLEQKVVDNLRVDPLAQSAADMKEQDQQAQIEQLQQSFEKQLGEQATDGAFDASRDAVTQHFVEKLNAANRFTPDVNRQYAGLLGSFYAVQAARAGTTPEELLARYPLDVRSTVATPTGDESATAHQGASPEITVNIGLDLPQGGQNTPQQVLDVLRKHGAQVASHAIHQSSTEKTVVARLAAPLTPEQAHQVSVDLGQEAIAQRVGEEGELHGPSAEQWRPFNPEFFLEMDGRTASQRTLEGDRLANLPANAVGPFEVAKRVAASYAQQAGLPYVPPREYVKVDKERAARIAQAFEEMEHNPSDPLVKAAYDAMIDETLRQWQAIKSSGLKVEFIEGADPYATPRAAILDVRENNHLWVFPTDSGFGSSDLDVSDNPLLALVEGETISGKPVRANDIFRIVHDYFGHIKEGVGFRADGEENAWRAHSAMYSPLARRAMTTETRGQNSWVNYGPNGEHNRTAKSEDTVYAPQKIGLLPEWVSEEGASDDNILNQSGMSDPAARAALDATTVKLMTQVPGYAGVAPYLTDEERKITRAASAQKLVDLFNSFPSAEEMASVAYSGRAKRGWYERSANALLDIFGAQDAPRFAALLAALSPQTSVESNAVNAIKTWVNWDQAGRPKGRREIVEILGKSVQGGKGVGSVLNAWINNSVTALQAADGEAVTLSGPKVDSFMNNLVGITDEVTNDAWMANYAAVDQGVLAGLTDVKTGKKGKGIGYKAMSALARQAAEIVSQRTGENWTPAEIQETVWSWAKTLYETRDRSGLDQGTEELLKAGGLTHEMVANTPDFATLFAQGVYRRVLEFGGYGEQLDAIGGDQRTAGSPGDQGSVAGAEGAGIDADAYERHLLAAARRLEHLRASARNTEPRLLNRLDQGLTPTQVVDDRGLPRLVYHGTTASITEFAEGKPRPTWFAEDASLANAYADPRRKRQASGGSLHPVYLDIRNPLDMTGQPHYVPDPKEFASQYGIDIGDAIEPGQTLTYAVFTHPAFTKGAKALGYDGLKVDEGNTTTWAPFNVNQIKPLFTRDAQQFIQPALQQVAQGVRGYLTFGNDVSAQTSVIHLLESSDLSTFLHESGHFFLEVMSHMAAQPGAPSAISDDMAATLKWMGFKGDNADWRATSLNDKRDFHEAFARGFEAYLFEGKAPSVEMKGVFQRFRSWLVSVYRSNIANLRVHLNPEIRGVFDRMIASTDAIREAEAEAALQPVFETKPANMTDVEWQEYQDLGTSATADAIDRLQSASLRDMAFARNAQARELKRIQKENKSKRDAIEEEVTNEMKARPVYRALDFLKRGLVDGEKTDGPHKISLPELEAEYEGNPAYGSIRKALNGMVSRDEGIHPAQVAEMFGYGSVDEMVRDVISAPKLADEVGAATDLRMLERYGDITSPEALERAASEAIHNDVRSRFVATELRALDRGTGKISLLTKAARSYAEQAISRLKVRDIRPAQYEAAERRAARNTLAELKKGDQQRAAFEKRSQLLNLYMTKAARGAQIEIDRTIEYFKKFAKKGVRENIDIDYLDQIDAMLERFDFRTSVTNKQLDNRKTLADWIKSQEEQGFAPALDERFLNEARRVHYRDLTLDELLGLRDSIKNIEHLGRLTTKLLKNVEEQNLAAAVAKGTEGIEQYAYKDVEIPVGARSWLDKVKSGAGEFLAMHRKLASYMREMDGNKDGGAMWSLFARPINAANDEEAVRTAKATEKLTGIFDRLKGENTYRKVFEPALQQAISLETRLMVAMNLGNEGNKQRVMNQFTDEQIAAIIAPLTENHWRFVQDNWNHVNEYKAEVREQARRLSGFTPQMVDASPFQVTTSDGKELFLEGGYFPIKYDPEKSAKAEADTAADIHRQLMGGAFTAATTRRGHEQARADNVNRALRYDFGVIFQHHAQVIHDLSWRETLIDTQRLLRRLDGPLRQHYGPEVIKAIRNTLTDVAVGGLPAANVMERGVNYLRAGVTVSGLGWNLWTSLFQPLGLTNSMARIGPKYVAAGISRVFKDATTMQNTTRWVREQSDFMRLRGQTQMREIAEIRQAFAAKGPIRSRVDQVPGAAPVLDAVNASFFVLIEKAQTLADIPTWAGAYEKAVDQGNQHDRAVALADQAVRDSQGGGQIADLAGVQRGGAFMKLWTNFYSWFNVSYNQLAERGNNVKRVGKSELPLLAVDFLLIAVAPAFLTSLLHAAVNGDDWDKLKSRVVGDQLNTYLSAFVGLREIGQVGVVAAGGQAQSYSGPAGARIFATGLGLAKQVQQGEADAAFWKAVNNTAGILFHYPSAQVNRTVTGVQALADGKSKNPAVVALGPPQKD